MYRILIIEDEKNLNKILQDYLRHNGFEIVSAFTGKEALFLWQREAPDLILLDLNLPDMDGLDLLREIRKTDQVPVIMVTARADEVDRLVGLELGADDYVSKPFSPREVVARVKVVLRRANPPIIQPTQLRLGCLLMDLRSHTATITGRVLELTPAEFQLLAALIAEPERVFTRLELLEATQGRSFEGYERTIDIHIKNIRHKLKELDSDTRYIQTVFGVGYKAVRLGK
ncbi:MAG TPA: response regulator transcription factor [Chloroflexi bacterium]|jgi:DNA-binding response OmpR family regulator|nr:response regulator transcription factor [Chloroflexota bacterium]